MKYNVTRDRKYSEILEIVDVAFYYEILSAVFSFPFQLHTSHQVFIKKSTQQSRLCLRSIVADLELSVILHDLHQQMELAFFFYEHLSLLVLSFEAILYFIMQYTNEANLCYNLYPLLIFIK